MDCLAWTPAILIEATQCSSPPNHGARVIPIPLERRNSPVLYHPAFTGILLPTFIFTIDPAVWVLFSYMGLSSAVRVSKRPSMPGDNSPGVVPDVKREEVDPLQSYSCHGSDEPMPLVNTSADIHDCKSRHSPICSFNPRPFPPPSLAGVPTEYIVDQLRALASQYWNKPETADCTISGSLQPYYHICPSETNCSYSCSSRSRTTSPSFVVSVLSSGVTFSCCIHV